jgi:PKD repeat protein
MRRLFTALFFVYTLAIGVGFGQTVVQVTANITSNTTWTRNNIYVLNSGSCLYVTNNAVLTVEPGTVVKGNPSALIITRGAKLVAEGTAEQPIVFTSNKAPGERRAGDWGGIALLGRAPLNVPGGTATLEGGCDAALATYGGTDPADNSGSLKFVRIEFAGIAFVPNQELNALTLAGVGTGTTIENVQTSFGGDDAFEWFGGTVNGKNLIAMATVDDMFDTDFGYSGKNQFLLGWSDPTIFDVSTSNGFESDNDGSGTSNRPFTSARFANVSLFGPRRTPDQSVNNLFGRSAHIRRSSRQSIYNAIFSGFPTGVRLESANSQSAFLTDTLFLRGIIVANATRPLDSLTTNFGQIRTKFEANNTTVANLNDLNITNPYPASGRPNFLPKAGSVVLTGANPDIYNDTYFQRVTHRGAFGTSDWTSCWAEFDPQNADYNSAINYASVFPSEIVATTTQNRVAFSATIPAGASVAWDFGDFTTSTEASPSKTYPALGNYNVRLTITSSRGCSRSITRQVSITSGTTEVAITGDITTNTTWTSDRIYRLTGSTCLYVRNNATLTIQPGTIIKGDPSALVITRGSKLIAEGTAEQPIIFTSGKAAGQRRAGDWGGIALLGRAPLNVPGGTATLEGGCDATLATYGGTDPADNSGSLKYVRIEFAGIAFVPNQELNSLTLAGVGTGTTIENIQTSFGGDDAFEWFGGTVNGKNLVAFSTVDDMFDTDFGYSGKNQYLLGWSDPTIFDVSTSNGFESDNDGSGTSNRPYTTAKFANVSIFGPRRTPGQTVNNLFGRGAHIRRASRQSIHNTIFSGFPTGIRLESTGSQSAFLNDTLQLKGIVIANATRALDSLTTTFPQIRTKFNTTNATTVASLDELQITNPYPTTGRPNFLPRTGSPMLSGANADVYTDAFFQRVNFRGAFGSSDWTGCWVDFDPQNADYSVSPVNYFANKPTTFTVASPANRATFTGPTGAGLRYSWDFGVTTATTDTSSLVNPVFTYPAIGNYNVTLVVSNARGCTATITRTLGITTSVPEIKELNNFRMFPNPTAGNTILELGLTARLNATVSVRNIAGQVVLSQQQNLTQGLNRVELATETLPNGAYTVEVKSAEGLKTSKLIVAKR